MHVLESLSRLISRFRYPISLPEDLANDLGLSLPNSLTFSNVLNTLSSCPTRRLRKNMTREGACALFCYAKKAEHFPNCSYFSYHLNKGWVVIALYFDGASQLNRAYVHCPASEKIDGFDLKLQEEAEGSVAKFASVL